MDTSQRIFARGVLMALAVALVAAAPTVARAGIVSTTGAVTTVTAPASEAIGKFESNDIQAWNELQNTTLTQGLAVDISVPGTSPDTVDSNLSPATIPVGTVISSYMLHFDVVGSPTVANARQADATVTFDQPVVGMMALAANLDASNAYPGLSTTTYATGIQHQLELSAGLVGQGTTDFVTLSADRMTLTVEFRDANDADDLRVITSATVLGTPEPAALSVLSVGLCGLLARRRVRG